MLYSYKELEAMKKAGIHPDWEKITKEQLEKLFIDEEVSNSLIAKLYGVSPEKVRSKRRKWDISIYSAKYIYKKFAKNEKDSLDILNYNAKLRLSKLENIDWISKALTHYIFRNGPVEDIHAEGKLKEEDMKTLNKFMVNKIAGLLKLADEGEWLKIEILLDFMGHYGKDWDASEIDTEDIDILYNMQMKKVENGEDCIGSF